MLAPTAALLRDTITILRATRTASATGGFTEAWTQVATVPGQQFALTKTSRTEAVEAAKPSNREMAQIDLDMSSFTVLASDRLQTSDGLTYEIITLDRQGTIGFAIGRRVV